MSITFPDSWSPLQHPHVRSELLLYLKDATRTDLWRNEADLEFLIHFFFDDQDFRPANEQIGWSLLNDKEADAITGFIVALDSAIGPRSKRLSQLSESDWVHVPSAAEAALSEILKAGEPVLS